MAHHKEHPMNTLAFLNSLGTWDMLIILALGLLIFGGRLPEVGKSLGRGIVEFRKGLKGITDDIEEQSSKPAYRGDAPDERPYRAPLTEGEDRRVSRNDSPAAEQGTEMPRSGPAGNTGPTH